MSCIPRCSRKIGNEAMVSDLSEAVAFYIFLNVNGANARWACNMERKGRETIPYGSYGIRKRMEKLLRMEKISKQFGDFFANRDVELTVYEGEVHTLLGENGAGKSTLMNVLTGLYQPTSGDIYFRGQKVWIDSPRTAVKLGIGMVHQHFMLIEAMTVFDNIIMGSTHDGSLFINKSKLKEEIQQLADKYDLNVELDKSITEISVGAQQRVEILKALYRGADLLVLDEPTAVLTDMEVKGLFQIIHRLTSEKKSVIFISHKMREVMEISDNITVLRAGKAVATMPKDKTSDEELANLMIGHKMSQSLYQKVESKQAGVLHFEHICYNKGSKFSGLNDITFSIRRGEIVGVAGVDGNGQSQLAQVATGVLRPEEGTLELKSERVDAFNPLAFIRENVAHIPEDRNKMGLVGNMSIEENLVLKRLEQPEFSRGKGWFLKKKAIRAFADKMRKTNDIRCTSVKQETRNLSGGNQQKVILARELAGSPDLLVAVHPTRGLDIGAAGFVHNAMIQARDRGCGILLISADLDEILKISDRIIVLFEGRVTGIFPGKEPPIEKISLAMAGK